MATTKKKTVQKLNTPKPTAEPVQEVTQKESKKAQIHALMERPEGATIEEMAKLTNWQNHTVRGFLSTLKKAGKTITSERINDERRYRIGEAPAKAEETSA